VSTDSDSTIGLVVLSRGIGLSARSRRKILHLIPLLRPEGVYAAALRTVCPQLPEDLES
jgi:hypothetical protein